MARVAPPQTVRPALALVPLRLFLGLTFAYAGIHKLSDPGFLEPDAPTFIGTQLRGFADGTPGGPLLGIAISHAELAGIGVALLEISIGVLVLLGFLTRIAAAAGLALSLLLFLTASWHTRPYFLGPDIVFAFAWIPFVLAGAEGQPTIRDLLARRSLGLRPAVVRGRGLALPELRRGGPITRRALLGNVLGLAALVTAAAAAASMLARGTYDAAARPRRHRARAKAPGGEADLGPARSLARGEALPYADPASGKPAMVVRDRGGKLFALSAVCTHAGCELAYGQDELRCPCHNSTFSIRTGAPERGPARRPLERAEVSERRGRILAKPLQEQ